MASIKSFSTGSEALVLIDGTCALCNRLARFVIRHDPDGRFRFATLDSARGAAELTLRGLPPPP
jgi:predicted DCC family thiol-disulfide oxidoreductase YuxK